MNTYTVWVRETKEWEIEVEAPSEGGDAPSGRRFPVPK